MTRVFGLLSMLGSIGAGLYLLASHAVGANSYLEVFAHGIGVYFVARGLFMGASLFAQAGYTEMLRSLGGADDTDEPDALDSTRTETGPE